MKPTRVRLIVTTYPVKSGEEARAAARTLIRERLAACVWVLPPMFSVYFWDGKITEDTEILLVVKTDSRHCARAVTSLKKLHPYSVPEIITLKPEEVNAEYERWLVGYLSRAGGGGSE